MKRKLHTLLAVAFLLFAPDVIFGQAPNLGTASTFALFTGGGAFDNSGASYVTGNIGSNVSPITGFPSPGTVVGDIHHADATSAQVASDVNGVYGELSNLSVFTVLTNILGNGQIFTAGVYNVGSAATLGGDLILDAENDQDAVFVIKIGGAFSTGASTNVILQNLASANNVYWQIGGQLELGANSVFKGTAIVDGAANLYEGASLEGRILVKAGAISLNNNAVTVTKSNSTTGVASSSAKLTVSVAPNPFHSFVVVTIPDWNKDRHLAAKIYGGTGAEVLSSSLTDVSTQLNAGSLQAGIYYYVISDIGGVVQSGKLISK